MAQTTTHAAATPHIAAVIVMGVTASGKSSVAVGLARALQWAFLDADDLHPASNVTKMASGQPLNDDDRWPWLDLVGTELARDHNPGGIVIACSALRRAYRDRLRAQQPLARFVHLTGTRKLLEARAVARTGHFMPASLLTSQLATLEPLEADENGITIDVTTPLADIVNTTTEWLISGWSADTASK